ncbi:hypothetical protein GQ53DRAFT_655787 [Thozetella sp. PMI_491]|nr:hypothetical protein GQ53DRAFT_655787 [Thozetella sp. PMI_491]
MIQKLIDEFVGQLDPSLILAIASDRDVVAQHDDIRSDLLALAETATAEAATGFDPSGLGHLTDLEMLHLDDEAVTSGDGSAQTKSQIDSTTTFSESSETLESPIATFEDQAHLSDAEKIANLQEIFNFAEHTIKFILKQSDGDFERAFEELQNRQYLEEHGELPKGVDGFLGSHGNSYGADRRRRPNGQLKAGQTQLHVNYSLTASHLEIDQPEAVGAKGKTRQSQRKKKATKTSAQVSELSAAPELGSHSLRTAAALARRGASDPLYRQAVAVYVDRSREELQVARINSFREAERLVDATSTPSKIDLHGVTVMDGVKIAKARVRIWWEGLGEDRAKKAQMQGFTVVTGLGRHSVNGVSRLRQAVSVALKNEGWRVATLTGEFYITGRA